MFIRVPSKKVNGIFRELKRLQETRDLYCLAPDKIPVSIDDLIYCISEQYSIKVIIHRVNVRYQGIRGIYERYANKVVIMLANGMGDDWDRFTIAKEIGHIIIDEAEDYTIDPAKNIEDYISETNVATENNTLETRPDLASEELAKVVAGEILFPFEIRPKCKQEIENGNSSIFKTAEELNIPAHHVESILKDSYMAMCETFWGRVNQGGEEKS